MSNRKIIIKAQPVIDAYESLNTLIAEGMSSEEDVEIVASLYRELRSEGLEVSAPSEQ